MKISQVRDQKLFSCFALTTLWFLLLVAGCSVPVDTPVVPTIMYVQPSHTPTAAVTPLATHTPTITPTRQPPTWTPLPTLSPEEAQALVVDLFDNNAGCRLPCWWGLTPGQTTWQTAQRFLEPFARVIYIKDSTGPVRYANVVIPTPENLSIYPVHDYKIRDGIIEAIEIDDPGRSPAFSFTELLNTYGPPSEVWIRTYREGIRDVSPPFIVALFYPDQGIVAAYGVEGIVQEGKVRGCPQQGLIPSLGLWSPELKVTFNEAADMFRWDPQEWAFRSLDEATGMEVDSFYGIFSDPINDTCLETPVDLWTPQF